MRHFIESHHMKIYILTVTLLVFLASCQNEESLMGDAYFKEGKFEEAIQSYNKYLRLKPRHVKTIYNRGRCYQELGQYDKALEDFNLVLKYDSHNENALLSIGQEFYRKNDYKSAIYYAEKVLERDPGSTMAFYLIGRSNHKQGHLRAALNNYTTALNLSPEFGEAYFHRSAVRFYLKQNQHTSQDYLLRYLNNGTGLFG